MKKWVHSKSHGPVALCTTTYTNDRMIILFTAPSLQGQQVQAPIAVSSWPCWPSNPDASISLGSLECIAPRLLSLRLSDVVTLGSSVTHFGGHTRQLLHLHFCYFSPQWDDASYRNLTYLRLKQNLLSPKCSIFRRGCQISTTYFYTLCCSV